MPHGEDENMTFIGIKAEIDTADKNDLLVTFAYDDINQFTISAQTVLHIGIKTASQLLTPLRKHLKTMTAFWLVAKNLRTKCSLTRYVPAVKNMQNFLNCISSDHCCSTRLRLMMTEKNYIHIKRMFFKRLCSNR